MPSRVVWTLLVVALSQALLGGAVLVTRSETPPASGPLRDLGAESVTGEPTGEPAGETTGAAMPGIDSQPAAAGPDGQRPTEVQPPSAKPLKIASSYGTLRPDEMYLMDPAEPGDETVIEGRRQDGAKWRMYARRQGSGDVCIRSFAWNVESGRGGGGGHANDCPAPTEWGFTLPSDNEIYIGAAGFAPGRAAEIAIVAKDGRVGKVPGVHRPDMGVSFFLAYVECDGPDWERFEARDEKGGVLGT